MTKLKKGMFGKLTSIDLYDCETSLICNKYYLKEYINKLCDLLKMKKYGETIIVYFGNDEFKGFSVVQLIETSTITLHIADITKNSYVDIFSCADYDSELVSFFSKDFFKAKEMNFTILIRK